MIKKISLLTLTFISFLFVGMMLPSVYAAAPSGDYSVRVSVLTTEDVEWTESGSFSSTGLEYGSKFSIDASRIEVEGMVFAFWLVNGSITNRQSETEFIVTTDLEVIAVFKPIDKFVVLYIDSNNRLVDTKFVEAEGTSTTLLDGETLTKPQMIFVGWSKPQSNIVEDTVIKALYDLDPLTAKVTIDILDETGEGAGTYDYNEVITVTATVEGFTHWSEYGEVVSYNPIYKFSAIKNRALKAETDGNLAEPVVFLQDVTGIRGNHESYLGQVYLPEGYSLLETGLLVSNTNPVPTYGGDGVEVVVSHSVNNLNEFLMSIADLNEYRFVRAYAIIKTIDDDMEIIHSVNAKHTVLGTFHAWTTTKNPSEIVRLSASFAGWGEGILASPDPNTVGDYHVIDYPIKWFGDFSTRTIEYKWRKNGGWYPAASNIIKSVDPTETHIDFGWDGGV